MGAAREPKSADARLMNWAKVALALGGMLVWGYGVHVDEPRVRWLGIALLALAFALRFLRPRQPPV